ncbi:MAG: hypothetical protein VX000_07225 [Myxococcota bacterium]|nr:hypothetical protein [Myxococcota bacterium]
MEGTRPDVRELDLEQYVLGEVPAERAHDVAARAADPEVAARIDAIRASDVDVLTRWPPERVAPDIRRKAGLAKTAANQDRGWVIGASVAAMTLLAVAVLPPTLNSGASDADPAASSARTKGVLSPELVVLGRGASGTRRLGAGDAVEDGDVLQVGYLAGGARHGAIGIIDGSGAAVVLYPDGGSDRLDAGGEVMLPQSITLDAPEGFVRILRVADDGDVDVDAVRSALTALADGDDPPTADLDIEGDPVVLEILLRESRSP